MTRTAQPKPTQLMNENTVNPVWWKLVDLELKIHKLHLVNIVYGLTDHEYLTIFILCTEIVKYKLIKRKRELQKQITLQIITN